MSLQILASPCKACPFRKDVPIYLTRRRREEIAEALINQQHFVCHGTVDYDVDEDEFGECEPNTSDAKSCAGAVKALAMVGGTTQMDRIAERLGMGSIERTANHSIETWDLNEWITLVEGATGDNPEVDEEAEVETCNTVGSYCIAPAGYMGGGGGGVMRGTVAADCECLQCGEAVCSECVDSDGLCGHCTEEEEDE